MATRAQKDRTVSVERHHGSGSARRERLATQIARELENQILAAKWQVGSRIGQEATLAADMGVSRWTLREAVRILESSGFVVTRKGAGGGLFVASSAHDFVCKTVSNYLEFVQVSLDEYTDVQQALGRLAIEEAVPHLPAAERAEIEAQLKLLKDLSVARQLESVGVIHHAVIRGSGNQALVLFIGALSRVSAEAAIYSGLDDVEWRDTFDALIFAIREMAQAVLDRRATDAQIAHDLLVGHLGKLFEASLVRQRKPITSVAPARAYSFFPPARPMKKVDRVEREIRETIIAAGWPVGGNLGSEKELAARFKAGRWVLREALRSLEQLGVVEMGRGGRSGLQIVSPDPEMVAQACRRQLKREGLRASDAAVVRSLLDDIARDAAHPMPICELFERALIE